MSWRKLAAGVLVTAAVVAGISLRDLAVDNRLERWVGDDAADAESYREFRDQFGSDEFLVVAISGDRLFDPDALDGAVAALDAIEQVPGVVRVEGPPVVYRDLFGAEDPDELLRELTSTPFYRDLFVSRDADVMGLLIEVAPEDEPTARRRIVDGVRRATAPLAERGLEVRMVGSPVLSAALDEVSLRESRRSFPIAVVLSMVVLALLLRSLGGMVVAAASGTATVVLTLGLMAVLHRPLNMVTTALPPLLWVLALANCIHILQRYQRCAGRRDRKAALAEALAETTRPCTLAAVTTALGFLSLATATMAPVRELGVFAAVGIAISLAVNLTVVPTLIDWLRVPARRELSFGRWSALVSRRPRRVVAVAIVVVAAAIASVPFISVESNPLGFLPADHETTHDYRWVGERLTGFYSMEVVVSTPGAWWDPEIWPILDRLAGSVSQSTAVARVVSPLDLMRKINQWSEGFDPGAYRMPADRDAAETLLDGLDGELEARLRRFAAPAGRSVRLSALVDDMDEGGFLELVANTRRTLAELPPGFDGYVTGMVLRLVDAQQRLVRSQVASLGTACVVVFFTIAVGLRSWRLMVVSIPPNLLPVLATLALMAVLRIPLDAATIMVASVALGIAVDNTVHLLSGYRRERRQVVDAATAVRRSLDRVGSALVVSSATACIGFLSLCSSAFVPIREFGVLAATAMLVALAADLLVVPAILVLRETP